MDTEQQAERARAILRDLAEPFEAIRQRHLDAFEQSALEDDEGRKRARHMLEALKQLRSEIETSIEDEAIQAEKVRKRGND